MQLLYVSINIIILYVDIINMHDICNLNKLHVYIQVLMLNVYIINSHIDKIYHTYRPRQYFYGRITVLRKQNNLHMSVY